MREISSKDFTPAVLMSDMPVVVDLYAPWCGPCRSLGFVLGDLSKEYDGRVSFVKINVEEDTKIMEAYGIRAIPTVLCFKSGEMIEKTTGNVSKAQLVEKIEALLK